MTDKTKENALSKTTEYDITQDRKAISILNHVLTTGHTAEVYIGKYGIVIREIRRSLKYDQSQRK